MEPFPVTLHRALLWIEADGISKARAIRSRVDGMPLIREPPTSRIRRRFGFDTRLFCPPPARQAEATERRIVRLDLPADYDDGGPTMARQLDEGCLFP